MKETTVRLFYIAASFCCTLSFSSWAESGAAPLMLNGDLDTKSSQSSSAAVEQGDLPASDVDVAIREKLKSYGNLLSVGPSTLAGVKAWVVDTANGPKTLYSVSGLPVVFAGEGFNVYNGQMLSASGTSAVKNGEDVPGSRSFAFEGNYTGTVPNGLSLLNDLPGYVEGDASPFKTLYVFFDPKCPYCHKAFSQTRKYMKEGYAIKWIPVDFVGGDQSKELASLLLTTTDKTQISKMGLNFTPSNVFMNIMTASTRSRMDELVTAATEINTKFKDVINVQKRYEEIDSNSRFILEQFKQHPEIEKQGVPVAFLFDNRIKKPKMVMGVSEDVVLRDIYGDK